MSGHSRAWYQARKFRMYLFWVSTSVVGSLVALTVGMVPDTIIAAYWIGSGIALNGVFHAHGLADAAHG